MGRVYTPLKGIPEVERRLSGVVYDCSRSAYDARAMIPFLRKHADVIIVLTILALMLVAGAQSGANPPDGFFTP